MKVSQKRIINNIETLATFSDKTDNPLGITRFSYSPSDKLAKEYLTRICTNLGLKSTIDPIGNITFIHEGSDPKLKPFVIGSHIDSVRNGGKYDGVVGVVGGIEVLSTLKNHNIIPKRSIHVMIFAEEEGSNFGTTMLGSKAVIGKIEPTYLDNLHTPENKTATLLIDEFGLNSKDITLCKIDFNEIHAMIELHIEQGVLLEKLNKKIGVVKAIAGMKTLSISIKGTSNHAGSTPMNLRQDPLIAASKLILSIEDFASNKTFDTTVATVGYIKCEPNTSNVIPHTVSFNVDIRDINQEGIDKVTSLIQAESNFLSKTYGYSISIDTIGESECVKLNDYITNTIVESAAEITDSYLLMNSGAVHDAAMMTKITDVGMIFIPSKNGISHSPNEFTSVEEIVKGIQLLFNVTLKLCC